MLDQYKSCSKLFTLLSDLEEDMDFAFDIEVNPLSISRTIVEEFKSFEDFKERNKKEKELFALAGNILKDHAEGEAKVTVNIANFQTLTKTKPRIYRIK